MKKPYPNWMRVAAVFLILSLPIFLYAIILVARHDGDWGQALFSIINPAHFFLSGLFSPGTLDFLGSILAFVSWFYPFFVLGATFRLAGFFLPNQLTLTWIVSIATAFLTGSLTYFPIIPQPHPLWEGLATVAVLLSLGATFREDGGRKDLFPYGPFLWYVLSLGSFVIAQTLY